MKKCCCIFCGYLLDESPQAAYCEYWGCDCKDVEVCDFANADND